MICYYGSSPAPLPGMTTSEWIYAQSLVTDLALDQVRTPREREFIRRRLVELQGRVRFEERRLGRHHAASASRELPDWQDDRS